MENAMGSAPKINENNHMFHLIGLLLGGLVLGFGIVSLYSSFGRGEGCLQCDYRVVGFNGVDDIQLLAASNYSVGLVVTGVLVMVFLNASAWRYTDGY